MHLRFCVRGTSPLSIFNYRRVAKQISTNPKKPLPAEHHVTRNAAGQVIVPPSEVLRVLRGGAFMIPEAERAGIRAIFNSRAINFFVDEIACIDPHRHQPIRTFESEAVTYRGCYIMEVPRFGAWMTTGTLRLPHDVDSEALCKALSASAEVGLGFNGSHGNKRGTYEVVEWKRVVAPSHHATVDQPVV